MQPNSPRDYLGLWQPFIEPRQLVTCIFDDHPGLHETVCILGPEVLRCRHVVHHRISRENAPENLVDVDACVGDREHEDQLPRLELNPFPEELQNGIDDEDEQEERH